MFNDIERNAAAYEERRRACDARIQVAKVTLPKRIRTNSEVEKASARISSEADMHVQLPRVFVQFVV